MSRQITPARRKEIEALIGDARMSARAHRFVAEVDHARLLDNLAKVAEEYLKGTK